MNAVSICCSPPAAIAHGVWARFRSALFPARQVRSFRDQPGAALKCKVGPCPLNDDQESVAESNQEKDVHKQPRHPGDETGDVNAPKIRHRSGTSNGGQAAAVAIVEIQSWHAPQIAPDIGSDRLALLDGDWRHARQQLAIGSSKCRQIPNNEYLWMFRNAEIGFDGYAPGMVQRRAQQPAQRRS